MSEKQHVVCQYVCEFPLVCDSFPPSMLIKRVCVCMCMGMCVYASKRKKKKNVCNFALKHVNVYV